MFGNRLKQLRKNNNKTQEDISKILGISEELTRTLKMAEMSQTWKQ